MLKASAIPASALNGFSFG